MMKPAAVLIAALAIAVPARAQEARVDPEHIMTVLKDAGYPAEYFNQDKTFRQILSKSGNYQFLVAMWDCVDGKECQTLEFYANFPREQKPTKEQLDAYSGPREGVRIWLDRRSGHPAGARHQCPRRAERRADRGPTQGVGYQSERLRDVPDARAQRFPGCRPCTGSGRRNRRRRLTLMEWGVCNWWSSTDLRIGNSSFTSSMRRVQRPVNVY